MSQFRVETDSIGPIQVPADCYWGAQTQRAVENFPISGLQLPANFIRALILIKKAWAQVNLQHRLLPSEVAQAIIRACDQLIKGELPGQFPVDVFQTGSATSTNMNANEVIANRATEILGGMRGEKFVHPNDHVNKCQSSNDIIPTALHLAALDALVHELIPALRDLHRGLSAKSFEFKGIVKIGRTHLMDAVPMRLGQEMGGYASQIEHAIGRAQTCVGNLSELALGGTAIGTGINVDPKLPPMVIAVLAGETKLMLNQAHNLFEALAARDAAVETSGVLKTIACSVAKIANDIRLLASGPRCGIGELILPELQPGSSIMPGKTNPVMSEMLSMVAAQVAGCDAAITIGGMQGHFELNTYIPLIAYNLLLALRILSNGCRVFNEKCVVLLKANTERCAEMVERSLMLVTALTPRLGYDASAKLAHDAFMSGKTLRQLALERKLLPLDELDKLLDARAMTGA